MTAQAQAVVDKALALPPVERAGLIEELLASFDRPARAAVDAACAEEAESRIEAHDRGQLSAIPLEDVVARIKPLAPNAALPR